MQTVLIWLAENRLFSRCCRRPRKLRTSLFCICVLLTLSQFQQSAFPQAIPAGREQGLAPIVSYIKSGWDTLTRGMTDCGTVVDPKLAEASVLYLPAHF